MKALDERPWGHLRLTGQGKALGTGDSAQRKVRWWGGGALDQYNVPVLLIQAPVQSEREGSSSQSFCYLGIYSLSLGQFRTGTSRVVTHSAESQAKATMCCAGVQVGIPRFLRG